MSGVLKLTEVLELVVHGFDDCSFSQEDFIRHLHQLVLHVAADARYQLETLFHQLFEEALGDIALVPIELSLKLLGQVRHRLSVVDVSRCEGEAQ